MNVTSLYKYITATLLGLPVDYSLDWFWKKIHHRKGVPQLTPNWFGKVWSRWALKRAEARVFLLYLSLLRPGALSCGHRMCGA